MSSIGPTKVGLLLAVLGVFALSVLEGYPPENQQIFPENCWLEDNCSFWKGLFLGETSSFSEG